MSWRSRFHAGDLVEVRSEQEILATLDEKGSIDGMPFMPEMLRFCGKQFRVRAVAHKTCDTIKEPKGRRIDSTVHLAGVICDGSAHGGCQAECNLFWKDAWLKPAGENARKSAQPPIKNQRAGMPFDRHQLLQHTQGAERSGEGAARYFCQTTNLLEASQPLPWWDFRQYLLDITTRNRSAGTVLGTLWLAFLNRLLYRSPIGYRALKALYSNTHRRLTGRPSPAVQGRIKTGTPTPTAILKLQAGELVRVKSKQEIEETIDEGGKNRGMSFDKEMSPYCGKVVRVRKSIDQIIDERTGKMLHMKQPCISLDNVFCKGDYSECRLMCPRAIPSYWREVWLERISGDGALQETTS
jgi:hypothetical protein